MANLRLVKTKIKSIKSTAKVTKALQMVSAAKIKKTQGKAEQFKYYSEGITNIIDTLGDVSKVSNLPLARTPKQVKNVLILVVAASKGFTGALNSNLNTFTFNFVKELKEKDSEIKVSAVTVYKNALKICNRLQIEVLAHFGDYTDSPSTYELIPVYSILENRFKDLEADEVYGVFPEFSITLVQKPVAEKLLPVSVEGMLKELKGEAQVAETNSAGTIEIFEPNKTELLKLLLREYFQSKVFNAVLQNIASEYSARMVAMKNATDNAKKLVKGLTLEYNRGRQEKITKEMLEVVGGSIDS